MYKINQEELEHLYENYVEEIFTLNNLDLDEIDPQEYAENTFDIVNDILMGEEVLTNDDFLKTVVSCFCGNFQFKNGQYLFSFGSIIAQGHYKLINENEEELDWE